MTREPSNPTRRAVLGGALALAGAGALAGCGAAGGGRRIRYWNLFGGGDGALMSQLEDDFRHRFPDIDLQAVTLLWGTPYYTKLAMAAAGGRSPDVAVMHLARLPSFAPGRLLDPFDEDLLAEVGIHRSDFLPEALARATVGGKLYAVPLDTHPFVAYYNTAVCEKAGLLDTDGRLRQLHGPDEVREAFAKTKEITGGMGLALDDADVQPWRLFWSLYRQQDGELELPVGGRIGIDEDKALTALKFMRGLTHDGLAQSGIDYPGSVALFSGGKAGFLWNGEWEVATFTAAKTPFSMTPLPNIFGNFRTAADSHTFVLPHQRNRDRATDRSAYQFIAFLLRQSVTWAHAGHIPAYQPAVRSAEYARLKPQSEYRDVASQVQLDPPAWFSGSAAQLQTEGGAAFQGVLNGVQTPERALKQFTSAVNALLGTPSPV